MTSFCKCVYCGRRAFNFQDGNCVGCGAPLPMPEREPDRIDVTCLGSSEREYLESMVVNVAKIDAALASKC